MTDKEQIIIDIDRCKYRDKYTNFCLAEKDDIGETYTICTGTDCYYKQLARKTQECEELKRDYQELEQRHNEVFQEFERLKIECEELKDFARREGNQREIYYKEFLRTNSVLEEIEEIVNVDFSLPCARTDCTYPEPCKDRLTENGTKCMHFALLKIKDIVRETEDV